MFRESVLILVEESWCIFLCSVLGLESQSFNILSLILLARPCLFHLSFLLPELGKPRRSTRPLAARTMARIVNLHSTFINREIKAILARCPRSNADQILHTACSPWRVTLSWNYSREEKLGMAGRSRCIAGELFVENFWKIRFDSFIADYDTRGKVDAREKISGKLSCHVFQRSLSRQRDTLAPRPFAFATRALFPAPMFQCSLGIVMTCSDLMFLPSFLSFFLLLRMTEIANRIFSTRV